MASELRFAIRCGPRQRPTAKSCSAATEILSCSRCSPHSSMQRSRYYSGSQEETTYVPSIDIPRLNGVSPVPQDRVVR